MTRLSSQGFIRTQGKHSDHEDGPHCQAYLTPQTWLLISLNTMVTEQFWFCHSGNSESKVFSRDLASNTPYWNALPRTYQCHKTETSLSLPQTMKPFCHIDLFHIPTLQSSVQEGCLISEDSKPAEHGVSNFTMRK